MPFQVTTAIRKMLAMSKPIKIIQGATSSGKTAGIVPIVVDKCIGVPRTKATIVAESIPAVKDGALQIFKDFMHDEGRWRDCQWIGNPMEYTFINGSVLQFKSFDTVGKAKAAGKRQFLFMNEGNHMPYEIADALMIRSDEIWIDFNADREFWAHTEVLPQPFAEFLKLTYLDNEAIPSATLEKMLFRKEKAEQEDAMGDRGYWWNWWQVYGLGEIGSLQGAVFENWNQVDEIPAGAEYLGTGLDFGFTNDPTAAVDLYRFNNELYVDEVIYSTGLHNDAIFRLLNGKPRVLFADSANPKDISELKRMGLSITGADKPAGSVQYGIQLLQQHRINVTKRSINVIKEFRGYLWRKDKSGKPMNEPADNMNHAMDSLRYVGSEKLGKRTGLSIHF